MRYSTFSSHGIFHRPKGLFLSLSSCVFWILTFKSKAAFVVMGTIVRLPCCIGASFFLLLLIHLVHLPAYSCQMYSNMKGLATSVLLIIIKICNQKKNHLLYSFSNFFSWFMKWAVDALVIGANLLLD